MQTKPAHYHFMGIGGISMSGLAKMLHQQGHRVSGCDLSSTAATEQLIRGGIPVFVGHDPAHLRDVDVLVANTAVRELEPELWVAREHNIAVLRRIELLGKLMDGQRSVGVVGSHGKTTTTSMVASVLLECGLDPSVSVGGELACIAGTTHLGKNDLFVAEIDESDSLFQNLALETAVITNVEDDHVGEPGLTRENYHASLAELHLAFARFASNAQQVVFCADWPGLGELIGVQGWSYGLHAGADYRACEVKLGADGAEYGLAYQGEIVARVNLPMPGAHNVVNSLAAVAVAHLYGLPFERIAWALGRFEGPRRRWEILGRITLGNSDVLVVDDYAHNPTKVTAALAAARGTGRRVRVVFQPHRYLRTQRSWRAYADILLGADDVFILDIFSAGEAPIDGVNAQLILDQLRALGHASVQYAPSLEAAAAVLVSTLSPGDLVLTLGAGDVRRVGQLILEDPRGK